MYDLSTLEKGPLALITNPLTALWKGLMARATTIGAYMGLILGLGHTGSQATKVVTHLLPLKMTL